MNFSEDWKSFFPVSVSSETPNLSTSSDERSFLGPLTFNPIRQTLTHLFSSPSLLPPPLHFPQLTLSRFLATSSSDSRVLPSTASSIAKFSGHQYQNDFASAFRYNRLEFLKYGNRVVLFFPTGENSEQVGFLVLYVEGSDFQVKIDGNGDVFRATSGASHCISRILVKPLDDLGESSCTVGYLLASTCYSVHWFSVQCNSRLDRPSVVYMGGKTFKTCSVAHACWSPHIPEESVVLLESGELFLFDLEFYVKHPSSNGNFKGTRLKVPWHDLDCSKGKDWLCCEFSWHPRILIVASSDTVFLVDLSGDKCVVSCILKVEVLNIHIQAQNERFLALSRAGPDGFYFTVASNSFLLLCDVRKHMMPIIRWVHGLDTPCFINVLSLSTLRSHAREDTFKLASQVGFCILLGSFWDREFNLFCYGSSLPSQKVSFASKLAKANKTFCAWRLPSEILLSGRGCPCGSCLLKEMLSEAALAEQIDWQMKKEMVLGFGIMNNDLASLLCEPDEYGGFTLVRLMSSGKLELQRYQVSWVPDKKLHGCHEQRLRSNRYLLFSGADDKYKFPKRNPFIKLDFLNAYVRGNLTELVVVKKQKDPCMDGGEKESFDTQVLKVLCEKLNACGVSPLRSSPAITAFFEDVKPSASVSEVALRRLWAELPLELLQLAFTKYSGCLSLDKKKAPMEFLPVPALPQLPPFALRKPSPCSNKRSSKVQCNDDIVGPVLPLPVLLVLREIYYRHSDLVKGKSSIEAEVDLKGKEIMKVAGEISGSKLFDDHAKETGAGSSEPKRFLLYGPAASKGFATDPVDVNCLHGSKMNDTLIFNVKEEKPVSNSSEVCESVGEEIFDDLCPFELKFNGPSKKFGPKSLKGLNALKRQMSKWQQGVDSYKELCIQSSTGKAKAKAKAVNN